MKFESVGITRPSSSDCASALGRVQRNLQVARKRELEEDILTLESSAANGNRNTMPLIYIVGYSILHTLLH